MANSCNLSTVTSLQFSLNKINMKPKWNLRLKDVLASSASDSPQTSTSKTTMHLSLHHEKLHAKKMEDKNKELGRAVKYCKDNKCKGYKAITDLQLQLIKDPRTINQHLAGNVITGNEKEKQRILTIKEEKSLVKYLVNPK